MLEHPETNFEKGLAMDSLFRIIKTWIETESGPTTKFSNQDLQLSVSIKGYKKIILERKWNSDHA
jgi:hypothetical protein